MSAMRSASRSFFVPDGFSRDDVSNLAKHIMNEYTILSPFAAVGIAINTLSAVSRIRAELKSVAKQ